MASTGKCLCGAVNLTLEDGNSATHVTCHCDNCQLSGGSPYATYLFVPKANVKLEGETIEAFTKADSGNDVSWVACKKCGTPLTHGSDGLGDNICLRSPLFPSLKTLPLKVEYYTCNRWAGVAPIEGATQLEKM
ncbi:hypothetical protein BT69DRAFT_1276169 [Atractiella rhizophila]|nr:hypothetical protein BT69DRAFT_1276169 [Atractiella rhizophila]